MNESATSMDLINQFCKIYIINLASRKDRRKEMEFSLRKIGLSVDFPKIEFYNAEKPDSSEGFRTNGARGCFLSHLGVLKDALNNGYQKILVFEDDLDFSKDFIKRVNVVSEFIKTDQWDIFYGGYENVFIKSHMFNGITLVEPDQGIMCAHFVAFSDEQIRKMVDFLETLLTRPAGDPAGGPMDVDGAYSFYRARHSECRTFLIHPPLGHQRPSRTDISRTPWFDNITFFRFIIGFLRKIKGMFKE